MSSFSAKSKLIAMKKLMVLLTLFGFLSCTMKRGSGNIIKKNFEVSNFHGIHAKEGFAVSYRKGSPSVVIEADDNLMKQVHVDVEDGILTIGIKNISVSNSHLSAVVTGPDLDEVHVSSASAIKLDDPITADKIKIESSSAGSFEGSVNAPEVIIGSSSAGRVEISGMTRTLKIEASSSGKVDAAGLKSESANVDASSAAHVKVHASVRLDAEASSGAEIRYSGGADVRSNQSSGGAVAKE